MKALSIVCALVLLGAGVAHRPWAATEVPAMKCTLHTLQKPCFVPLEVVSKGMAKQPNVACAPGNPAGYIARIQAPPRQLNDDGLYGSISACLYRDGDRVKAHFWGWLSWGCQKEFDVPDVALDNQENISLHIYDTCRQPIGVRMGNTVVRDADGKPIGVGVAVGAYANPDDELHGGKLVSPWLMGGLFPVP